MNFKTMTLLNKETIKPCDFYNLNYFKKSMNLEVDLQNGPYKKIQEAIDAATPGSTIIINQGLYVENLMIKKENLLI